MPHQRPGARSESMDSETASYVSVPPRDHFAHVPMSDSDIQVIIMIIGCGHGSSVTAHGGRTVTAQASDCHVIMMIIMIIISHVVITIMMLIIRVTT